MRRCATSAWLVISLAGCGTSNVFAYQPTPDGGLVCEPSAEEEAACDGRTDEDCDGFTDCLDPDCDGDPCGEGCTCTAGGCVCCEPGQPCETPLPRMDNVRVTVRGDTALVEFDDVGGAVDYRIYEMPPPGATSVDAEGYQTITNAIYRCAGDRLSEDRAFHPGALLDYALVGNESGYARSESESELGYVFTTPGPGRSPVYRVADPEGGGGYLNAEWIASLYREANSADYVIGREARDALVAQGWRDDGVAFYAPDDGDRTIFRSEHVPGPSQGDRVVFFFPDGPERDARSASATLLEERFRVHSAPALGAVMLFRIGYYTASTFDVLAAGDAQRERVLRQRGPLTALAWPGLRGPTVLVIEALDAGCPFPGGYLSAFSAPPLLDDMGNAVNEPSITLDEARLPTGEVFVNGQHDPSSRPRPIARAFVDVEPAAPPPMDFYTSFDDPSEFEGMRELDHPYAHTYRNDAWAIDTQFCQANFTFGSVLGQLHVGLSDCRVTVVPRRIQPRIARDRFLHVRTTMDVASTNRRFPQILVTSAPMLEEGDAMISELPVMSRLGPVRASDFPGPYSSIVVMTHHQHHELQVQFCGHRGWGPTIQCPRANLYGYPAGDPLAVSSTPWNPVPVIADRAGLDRPVQFDLFVSTERVYVLVDGQPAGCARLPDGEMPEGPVTVAYMTTMAEGFKDEVILEGGEARRRYEQAYSLQHSDRRVDDLGIDVGVPIPPWDESILPCGTELYGGATEQ